MSRFVDMPEMLPAFEPRFPVRRLIADRGGVYDKRIKDGMLNDAPMGSLLDSLQATLGALDPLVVALTFAGYDVREVVVASSWFGDPAYVTQGCVRASPRSGLGYGVGGSWTDMMHIVDTRAWLSIVALRVLGWRHPLEPAVVPVSLAQVADFQAYADPSDPDATALDGWLVLGTADGVSSSQLVARTAPAALTAVVAAIDAAAPSNGTPPGLVRMLDPATWAVPLEREAPTHALRIVAQTIWDGRLSAPGALVPFLGYDAAAAAAQVEAQSNRTDALLRAVDTPIADTYLADLAEEQERRRVLLEPMEGSLPSVIAGLRRTHWALALMQLHEYGLVNLLPPPATLPPAIPVVDLTGYYTSVTDAGAGFIAMMQLNQAGDELHGWWVDNHLEVWPIGGTFRPEKLAQGRFEFALTSTWDGSHGSLYVEPVPSRDPSSFGFYVSWETSSVIYVMARRDRRARVEPATVVAALQQTRPTALSEPLLLPLHWLQKQRIVQLGYDMVDHIETVSGLLSGNASFAVQAMDGAVTNEAVAKDLADADGAGGYVARPLLTRLRAELRNFLASRPIAAASNTDGWFQLLSIVAQYPNESAGLRALLGLPAGPPHRYEYDLSGAGAEVGAGAGVGGSAGAFNIRSQFTHKTSCPGADTDPHWADVYRGTMGVAGGSIEIGAGADVILGFYETGTNDLDTPDEWLRDDFLCDFVAGELAWAAGVFPGALGPGGEFGQELWEGYTFFRWRDGAWATGRGDGWFVQGGVGAKAGIGLSLTGAVGCYDRRDGGAQPQQPPPGPPPTLAIHGANHEVTYFQQGSAWLTDAGKRTLKDLVLAYRPLLDDAGTYIVISGDASRTAGDTFNRDLSGRRILAVHDYVRSLLTTPAIGSLPASCALAVGDSHILLAPYGESRPTWAGLPDEYETPEWRKATIVISGRYIELLQGAAVLYAPESRP